MDFEKNVPDWSATGTEPPESLKQSGFEAGYKPPAAYFNWFWNRVSACLAEIREKLKGHAEDKENPHGVTAAQVGLGNADNTADSEKHVAYAGTAGSANKVANQMIIRFNGGGTESTDKWTYDGSTGRSVNITPANIGAAKDDLTNVKNADLQSKIAAAAVGVPIANAESSDGIAYTATVPGVTELINGMLLTIIPSMTSTSTNITLDVNGLGATNVRLPLSFNTAAMDRPRLDTFYVAERPITLQYDANYAAGGIWKVFEKNKTSAQDLYGVVPIESGGTNANTADAALENLGAAPKVHTHTVSDVDGAFAAADYDGLIVKTGNTASQNMKAGRGITAVTTYSPKQAGSGEASPDNIRPISGWTGAALTRCGKNLMPTSASDIVTSFGITVKGGQKSGIVLYGTASATGGVKAAGIDALPAGTYTVSTGALGGVNRIEVTVNGVPIAQVREDTPYTLTLAETSSVGLSVIIYDGADCGTESNPTRIDVQLEKGRAVTDYAPYQGNTYAADFGQTVYGGTLDWQTGVLTVGWKLARLTSDGTWSKSSTAKNGYYLNDSALTPGKLPFTEVRCNVAKYTPDFAEYRNTYNRVYTDNTVSISIDPAVCGNTLDSFKAWLDANEIVIAYKLTTPTTIQLTPLMIESLAGENTVYSDGESNVVTFNHDGALMYIMNRIAALEAASVNV